ncbi:hypothetical protein HKX48_001714 [Thoreauomyces humboldtii]|nr:hypothetical protein HKX48_001714 [Thoreauomyces humboldtii]
MNDTLIPQECQDVVANITDALTSQYQASQDQQVFNLEANYVCLVGVCAAIIHPMLLVLFIDRVAAIRSKPTLVFFVVAVVAGTLNWINVALGNTEAIPWYFDVPGTSLYFYTSVATIVTWHLSISMIQYWRIKDSLRTAFGRPVQLALFAPFVIQLCLELSNQLYGAILFSVTLDYEQDLYISQMVWATTAYRFFLDLSMSAYALSIVYGASNGFSRENKAFFFAYLSRVLLFLGIDVLDALGSTLENGDMDLDFGFLLVWMMPRFLQPFKVYLLLTDITRIRMLLDNEQRPSKQFEEGTVHHKVALSSEVKGS